MAGEFTGEVTRSWRKRARLGWWVKFLGALAATIVAMAGAGRVLGISIDIERRSESDTKHEALRQELRASEARTLERVEASIARLSDRIDLVLSRGRVR
jgi:hypothetical protein